MKKLLAICLLPVLTGCLSLTATNPTVAEWTVNAASLATRASAPKFGVARLSQVAVRAPYDVRSLTVLRGDYSLAFDPYNRFAALPSQLLRGPVQDVLSASGLFGAVVSSTSAAAATHVVEVTVTSLRLDCSGDSSQGDRREAEVGVTVLVLDGKRSIVASAQGVASEDARHGEYMTAFSTALTMALEKALGDL